MRTSRDPRGARWLGLGALVLLIPTFSCGARATDQGQTAADAAVELAPKTGPITPPPSSPAATQGDVVLPSLPDLVDAVKAAVVNVEVTSRVQVPQGHPFGNGFGRGFPFPFMQPAPQERTKQGQGSGFLIDDEGLILTNNHVVDGAVSIRVKLDDGRGFDAEILGTDPLTDLALIRLKGDHTGLPYVKLGDSDALRVGEWVVAIGNPFGLASSVSAGIISARARNIGAGPYDEFLQTDAAINPGNSGGPLFNLQGEVVGINTAIIGGGSGIGFAVPSNLAKALLPQLQESGAVTRGWLGVAIQDLTAELAKGLNVPVPDGAVVADVSEGSPAEEGGLKADDVVVELDGQPITSSGELTRQVALKAPGSVAKLGVYRDGRRIQVEVKLGTRPDLEGVGQNGRRTSDDDERQQKLGLTLQDVPPQLAAQRGISPGAAIVHVRPGSPADRAGLAQGMVIVEAGGEPVRSASDFQRVVGDGKPGDVLLLRVQAGESRVLRALTLPE